MPQLLSPSPSSSPWEGMRSGSSLGRDTLLQVRLQQLVGVRPPDTSCVMPGARLPCSGSIYDVCSLSRSSSNACEAWERDRRQTAAAAAGVLAWQKLLGQVQVAACEAGDAAGLQLWVSSSSMLSSKVSGS